MGVGVPPRQPSPARAQHEVLTLPRSSVLETSLFLAPLAPFPCAAHPGPCGGGSFLAETSPSWGP